MMQEWYIQHTLYFELVSRQNISDKTVVHKLSAISPGGRLNKKDGLTRYGNSHVKDKTS